MFVYDYAVFITPRQFVLNTFATFSEWKIKRCFLQLRKIERVVFNVAVLAVKASRVDKHVCDKFETWCQNVLYTLARIEIDTRKTAIRVTVLTVARAAAHARFGTHADVSQFLKTEKPLLAPEAAPFAQMWVILTIWYGLGAGWEFRDGNKFKWIVMKQRSMFEIVIVVCCI